MTRKKQTKADLVDALYQSTGLGRQHVQQLVDLLLEHIRSTLAEGASIELRGFGTFEVRLRKGRAMGRNPRTGNPVFVVPHWVAVFRPGRDIKKTVRELDPNLPYGAEEPDAAGEKPRAARGRRGKTARGAEAAPANVPGADAPPAGTPPEKKPDVDAAGTNAARERGAKGRGPSAAPRGGKAPQS
ncbi:MAG: HU family DNA-binding protein [Spirochaetaceae bacterium]|jgi:integration host factor subunit beta|nr:HU family DNA-binding protein [Spirochaetaceae bacterium]